MLACDGREVSCESLQQGHPTHVLNKMSAVLLLKNLWLLYILIKNSDIKVMAVSRNTSYQASSIEVLTGLEPVKKRPGMYTDTTNPNHLAQEAIDNSVDEALAGHAQSLAVVLHADHSISITDDGRGMPTDTHPEHGISGVEIIMTKLHAGAKFSNKSYTFSGGLHGVGISVANALSKKMVVSVFQGGHHHQMTFEHGHKTSELTVIDQVPKRQTGTQVRFWPDAQYFDVPAFDVKHLQRLLRAKAVLCSGLKVTLHVEAKDQDFSWCYENGLKAYLETALVDETYLPNPVFQSSHSTEDAALDYACTWVPQCSQMPTESYVNLIPTPQGGTHVNGFRQGMLDAIREFCEIRDLLPRTVRLKVEDVCDACAFVLSVKIKDPQFSGQTKDRLTSRQCAGFVSHLVKDAFSLWLNQHVDQGVQLAEIAIERAQSRLRQAKKVVRKKVTSGPALPGKLADCISQIQQDCELFLVEGDSAGGSAKQARNKNTQAVLPLRGKILNTWEVDSDQVLASQTVHDIAIAIGVDPGSSDVSACRYGKICLLADADSDGNHISTLLCALFLKHFYALVEAGYLYVAMPPLYRIDVGKDTFYALDEAEKDHILSQNSHRKTTLQRFKGLGEMNPEQLKETAMAPATRRLVKLTVNQVRANSMMDKLLAKKRSDDRRAWLEQKGNLARVGESEPMTEDA